MWQAITAADKVQPLAILTDSMNVISTLQAWDQAEFFLEMEWQRNANIIIAILMAINARAGPVTIVNVKSHRGVSLNEHADVLAGAAVAAGNDEVETLFTPTPPDNQLVYSWTPSGAEEPTTTSELLEVYKRWDAVSRQQVKEKVQQQGMYAGELLTHKRWGQHLLHQSQLVRQWTETEEQQWMQMAGWVYPVMTYLRRIDKHPNGECPWCRDGTREMLCHFQSECTQFALNRTAAHHVIVRATLAALKDMRLPHWQFLHETAFENMPFKFKWSDTAEEAEQRERRPDSVAWNPITGQVRFLEFTLAMDNPDNTLAALEAKGHQYNVAVAALSRAQCSTAYCGTTCITSVATAPLIFGVRGTVLVEEAAEALQALNLTSAQLRRALAGDVRAAITVASEMCTARVAALKCLPPTPLGPDGKRAKVVIPQKPFVTPHWRVDRRGGDSRGGGGREGGRQLPARQVRRGRADVQTH